MWRPLLVAALLVLSGCATTGPELADSTTAAESGGDAPTDRALTPEDADPSNPWGDSNLTVAVNNTANDSRNFHPLVETALDFWANNSTEYVPYSVGYDLEPNASDPDIVVRFVERIDSCANVTDAAGCAPFVTAESGVSPPVSVEVAESYSNESTLLILKHELGHTLGLNHSAEPQSVMSPTSQLTTLPRPNATERDLPWDDSNFTVYVADETADGDADRLREQVGRALDYYAGGANGTVPANVTAEFVTNRTDADVVVNASEELSCREAETGSCGEVRGTDPDGDGALEQYDELHVTLSDVDPDAVGWHVGYWLGYGFGFEDESEWPEPFRNATDDERQGEWWE
ncbi:matrixin family metalloprotease [Halorussus amylolyticus]|uniref:matrixin family metalloprotease n=1 Tax=Halorussus amylolyticus TaxID=1126242 RepID=UPI001EE4C58C|nr:matrixin family metalloprotease [Halorussus amylolyticus]